MSCPVVELFYDGAWNDITDDVNIRDVISITRGRRDEDSHAPPGHLPSLTLNNRDGKYSPRNPASPLYGKITRNTPIRVRVPSAGAGLDLPGEGGSYASTPDHASLDITGDIDVRVDVTPETWRPAAEEILLAKWSGTTQRSYMLLRRPDGKLRLFRSADGAVENWSESTVAVPADAGRLAVRATLDANDGAGNRVTTFYTAPSIAGPFTQLGSVLVGPATTLFASTASLAVGADSAGDGAFSGVKTFAGHIHAAELRNGINGTVVASPVFEAQEPGDVEFTDAAGRTWTVHGDARIGNPGIRFCGEVASWPVRWTSELDVWVPLEAAGIRRRLSQGQTPLKSALFRDISTVGSTVVAYWPLEDGSDATTFASGLQGDTSTLRAHGEVSPASHDGFVASNPIPTVDAGFIRGSVPRYSGAVDQRIFFLLRVPEGGVAGDRVLLLCTTSGPYTRWDVVLKSDGNIFFRAFDSEDVLLYSTVPITMVPAGMNGRPGLFSLWLSRNGANTDWQLAIFDIGASSAQVASGTVAGRTFNRFRTIQLGTTVGSAGTAYGHLAILNGDVHGPLWATAGTSLTGWTDERAGTRMTRLATDEGIPLRLIGDEAETEKVGPQRAEAVLELIDEAAEVDLGAMGEARDVSELTYRARHTMYNQRELVLDYEAGHISPPLEPTDDDQATRNEVTVSRTGGSSATAVEDSGPMSVLSPPEGAGRYDHSVTINAASDTQLPDQAGWRLHLGTVDEARYPSLTVLLHNEALAELVEDILALDVGDRIRIVNTPPWVPGDIDLIVQGYTESMDGIEHPITFNCTPATPWTVGEVSDGTDDYRIDTDGSETTASFVAGTDTSMSVAVTDGELWTTDPAELPLDIRVSGVVLTVTAITGAVSPQTFTVEQTPVNGIVKTIAAGSDVRLAHPMIVAL